MKTLFYTLAIFLSVIFLFTSCKKEVTSPGSDGGGSKANTIMGTIYDANGNKFNIPGADVVVHALGNVGSIGDEDAAYNFTMDANSHYEGKVTSALYGLHARAFMPLNGNKVCIDLEPTDGKPEYVTQASKPGIVKDFKLMLTGLAAGGNPDNVGDYYGAHINFIDGNYFSSDAYWHNLATDYPGAKVYFNFAIAGPLLDGSQGQSQQVEAPVDSLTNGYWFYNIPYAAYRVTAKLVTANGNEIPLKLSGLGNLGSDLNERLDYIDLTFPPNPDDVDGRPIDPTLAIWIN